MGKETDSANKTTELRSMLRFKQTFLNNETIRWNFTLVILLFLLFCIFGFINPKFLSVPRLLGSVNDFISVCIISLSVTFVLVTGGMDIQAGSIVGLTSISVGLIWQTLGVNIWAAAVLSLLIGLLCGALSGFLVAFTNVQPMVVTLGGQFLYSGIAISVTRLSSTPSYKGISGFPNSFTGLINGRVFGVIPNQVIIFVFFIIITYVLLHKTKYGRKVFLCGVNKNAAEYSGIKSKIVIMSTYMLSGISASVAGIMLTGYLGTAKADFGNEITLPIITAVVLGGTSIQGGKGSIIGTAVAAVLIVVMRFGLSMSGVNTQYFDIPVGVLLIAALTIRSASEHGGFINLFKKNAQN